MTALCYYRPMETRARWDSIHTWVIVALGVVAAAVIALSIVLIAGPPTDGAGNQGDMIDLIAAIAG